MLFVGAADNEIHLFRNDIDKKQCVAAYMLLKQGLQEEYGSEGAKNLTDNDPSTYWHTMYSITLAKHPHWVDLDAGEVKSIKGFKYLPRQDGGSNGNIKAYKIQLSMDGQNWGETVNDGEFENNSKEKTVYFKKPIKARYIRFTALSSHNNADYASGAELTILAE